jgi:hypothetical protein
MRLVDLDPGWWTEHEGRSGMGVVFECPHCKADGRDFTHLGVWFANPIDGGPPASPECRPVPRWQRTGDTFETLTLTPSIDVSKCGHWHGHITNGEIT